MLTYIWKNLLLRNGFYSYKTWIYGIVISVLYENPLLMSVHKHETPLWSFHSWHNLEEDMMLNLLKKQKAQNEHMEWDSTSYGKNRILFVKLVSFKLFFFHFMEFKN